MARGDLVAGAGEFFAGCINAGVRTGLIEVFCLLLWQFFVVQYASTAVKFCLKSAKNGQVSPGCSASRHCRGHSGIGAIFGAAQTTGRQMEKAAGAKGAPAAWGRVLA
mgnify:CR=1 FL=1